MIEDRKLAKDLIEKFMRDAQYERGIIVPCLKMLIRILKNVVDHPDDPRYRRINTCKVSIQAKIC